MLPLYRREWQLVCQRPRRLVCPSVRGPGTKHGAETGRLLSPPKPASSPGAVTPTYLCPAQRGRFLLGLHWVDLVTTSTLQAQSWPQSSSPLLPLPLLLHHLSKEIIYVYSQHKAASRRCSHLDEILSPSPHGSPSTSQTVLLLSQHTHWPYLDSTYEGKLMPLASFHSHEGPQWQSFSHK